MKLRICLRLLGAFALCCALSCVLAAQEGGGGQNPTAMLTPPPLCTAPQAAAIKAGEPVPNPDGTPVAAGRGGGRGRGGALPCHVPDPREGLKAGLYDAGQASWNMQLVTTMHQPEGMLGPEHTADGQNLAPCTPPPAGRRGGGGGAAALPAGAPPYCAQSLNYANSDLAFGGNGKIALQGNFHGLIFYDISDPEHTKLSTIVTCPGGQGDVSIWGNLAFMSVESYGRIDCGAEAAPGRGGAGARGATPPANGAQQIPTATNIAAAPAAAGRRGGGGGGAAADPNREYGVRIFDISDPMKPKQVAAVETCRGSHTHTLAVDPKDKDDIYVYVSGTSQVRSAQEMAGCTPGNATTANVSTFGIDVIKVPLAHPDQAKVVNHAYIFADANTGAVDGLEGRAQGTGEPVPGRDGCHDVTSYPYMNLLGGACGGNGLVLDISDPVHPKRLDDVADAAFSFWHSATFSNDGSKVLFSDEWGGGTQPMCQKDDPPMWGGDAVYYIEGSGESRHMKFGGYYKMPAWQTQFENCVAHNGGLVPVPGRDIMSQAFYQGGATVFDFTDPSHIKEIAYFDRGPIAGDHLVTGGYWSIYYYNGYLYGSEIERGFDVFKLVPSEDLSQNEIDAAKMATREGCGASNDDNLQCQAHYVWPANFTVARAYLDQLTRDKALPQEKIDALETGMKSVEGANGGARKSAETSLNGLAAQLGKDASTAKPIDAKRMEACASTIEKADASMK